jgi:hypothetical protein
MIQLLLKLSIIHIRFGLVGVKPLSLKHSNEQGAVYSAHARLR